MDTLTALTTRVSAPRLEAPGPSDEQLDMLLRAAIRAPDHGLLRPWRFIVLQGRQRERLRGRDDGLLLGGRIQIPHRNPKRF